MNNDFERCLSWLRLLAIDSDPLRPFKQQQLLAINSDPIRHFKQQKLLAIDSYPLIPFKQQQAAEKSVKSLAKECSFCLRARIFRAKSKLKHVFIEQKRKKWWWRCTIFRILVEVCGPAYLRKINESFRTRFLYIKFNIKYEIRFKQCRPTTSQHRPSYVRWTQHDMTQHDVLGRSILWQRGLLDALWKSLPRLVKSHSRRFFIAQECPYKLFRVVRIDISAWEKARETDREYRGGSNRGEFIHAFELFLF